MKIIKGLLFITAVLIAFISVTGNIGCANIIPPTGGPKDTIPPHIISAVPRDSVRRFDGKTITLTFDEYVEIKEKEQNVIVNPTPKITPTIESKLKVVTIKLRDTLQPNTTYSINFGNSIRDINEGNIFKHFTYVFSTGVYLDSLEFSGKVTVAISGKADSTMIVVLHRNLTDSAVANERPRYVTRVDTSGNFTFQHLAPGTYRVYAMKDEGNSRRYSSKSQLFAFADEPVVIQQNTPPVTMFAYVEDDSKPVTKKNITSSNTPPPKPDKNKRLQVQTNIAGNEFDVLDTVKILFGVPLKDYDSTKIRFTDDQYKDIVKYNILKDSTGKKLTLLYKWTLDTKYNIILSKDFGEDTLGKKLAKDDTIAFHTKRESQYGEVHLRFRNLDLSKNPVLLFLQSDAIKFSYPFNSREFQRKLFPPGEYELRILFDENRNGHWDPGTFFGTHKQPEKVRPLKIPRSKTNKFNVKANWDNDLDLDF